MSHYWFANRHSACRLLHLPARTSACLVGCRSAQAPIAKFGDFNPRSSLTSTSALMMGAGNGQPRPFGFAPNTAVQLPTACVRA
jgi:hypothetical protein